MFFPHPTKTFKPANLKAESQLQRGRALLESGELEAALSLANAARQAFQDCYVETGLAQAERLLGDVLVQLGQPDLAVAHYKQAAGWMKNADEAAACWRCVAEAYEQMGRRLEAIEAYRQARRLYRSLKLDAPRLDATYRLAFLYYELEDWANAEKYYRKALTLATRMGQTSARDDILLELGNSVAHQGRLAEARRLFEQSAAHARASADDHVLAAALHGLAVTFTHSGRHEHARALFEQSLQVQEEHSVSHSVAYTLYEMGMNEAALGQSDHAVRLVQQAVSLYERLNAPEVAVARAGLAWLKAQPSPAASDRLVYRMSASAS